MAKRVYETEYAGRRVSYTFRHPGTRLYFRSWLRRTECESCDIAVTPERLARARTLLPSGSPDAYVEFRTLIELTSRALIADGLCIFHAVAVLWHGYAWLITAPSGTGKTTQLLNWQHLLPGETQVICGDMPVLEQRRDGSVWAWSSPWNGKESFGAANRLSAPVAGIVLLEQGKENVITRLTPRDAIRPLFSQFILLPETETQAAALCGLMDHLLQNVPVWKLVNLGDETSTSLLCDTFAQRLDKLTEGGVARAL